MTVKGRVLLVRHGQTFANTDKVWHGHTDTALTPHGKQQTVLLGQYFHHYLPSVDAIYASPLQRAHNTAKQIAINSGANITLDQRLIEFGAGDWENFSFTELHSKHNFFNSIVADPHHRAPNGESRAEVTARFVAAVEEAHLRHQDQNIVIVAHGIAISLGMAYWEQGDSGKLLDYRVDNTAVSEIDLSVGKVIYHNRSEHLEIAEETSQ